MERDDVAQDDGLACGKFVCGEPAESFNLPKGCTTCPSARQPVCPSSRWPVKLGYKIQDSGFRIPLATI